MDTRVGTIDVAIPKLREGTYFPEWLLERRKRAERALTTVVADCYLAGVSTRRMDKLVKTLGIDGLSKSQVSRMAQDLDEQVAAFRHRPLGDSGPFTFVAADALTMKVREHGRVINSVVLVATGVNGDGHREVLGLRVVTSETGPAWNEFFADLVARGLHGVRLVTSDAHAGLVDAIAANLPGASWQRCRTHYAANLMSVCPKAQWPAVKAMLHSVYDQPDADSVNAQFDKLLDMIAGTLPAVHDHLDRARADVLAFTSLSAVQRDACSLEHVLDVGLLTVGQRRERCRQPDQVGHERVEEGVFASDDPSGERSPDVAGGEAAQGLLPCVGVPREGRDRQRKRKFLDDRVVVAEVADCVRSPPGLGALVVPGRPVPHSPGDHHGDLLVPLDRPPHAESCEKRFDEAPVLARVVLDGKPVGQVPVQPGAARRCCGHR